MLQSFEESRRDATFQKIYAESLRRLEFTGRVGWWAAKVPDRLG